MLALTLIDRLRRVSPPAANRVLSALMPAVVPLTSVLGLRVLEVSAQRARLALRLRWMTRNHVGSVYFGVQMTLAELCMGLALFESFTPGPYGLLVTRVEADFHRKGKGWLTATCEPPAETLAQLAAPLTVKGARSQGWVDSVVTDEAGQKVATARFELALKRFA